MNAITNMIFGNFEKPEPKEFHCKHCDFKHRSAHLVVHHTLEAHPEKADQAVNTPRFEG